MAICFIVKSSKGTQYQCNLFVVCRNRTVLLGMADCKQLLLLTVNCETTDDKHKEQCTNEQMKEVKLKPKNNDRKDNFCTYKDKPEPNYFVAGPDT